MAENARFIDWARGQNGNPYTVHKSDEYMLLENKNLFARKFSETIDPEIIECIFTKILKENESI